MARQRSAVARVAWIVPSNPRWGRSGSAPEWSMCAWERITASTDAAGKGSERFLASDSERCPWKSPQSRRTVPDRPVKRCLEPGTVRAAPQKLTRTGLVSGIQMDPRRELREGREFRIADEPVPSQRKIE